MLDWHRTIADRHDALMKGRGPSALRVGHIVTALLVLTERARLRRQLLALSDYALRDLGRGRAEVMSSDDRPFVSAGGIIPH